MPGAEPPSAETSRGRALHREVDKTLRDVDTDDLAAAGGQGVGMAARTAADVEHPGASFELELVEEELDLLLRSLRERVAQVRRAQMIGDRLEPVLGQGLVSVPLQSHRGGK
jgi:hypothetical protein